MTGQPILEPSDRNDPSSESSGSTELRRGGARQADKEPNAVPEGAYLVVRQDNRWTDVFRLKPNRQVRIGRSSTCQIVVRSEMASREHAEIFPQSGGWVLRDCNSRNGTRIRTAIQDEQAETENDPVSAEVPSTQSSASANVTLGEATNLTGDHRLKPGDVIEIAGYRMTFVHAVSDAFSQPGQAAPASPLRATPAKKNVDQGNDTVSLPTVSSAERSTSPASLSPRQPMVPDEAEADPSDTATITHRQDSSEYLPPVPGITEPSPPPSVAGPTQSARAKQLFQLAFQLARTENIAEAANLALHTVTEVLQATAGAILLAEEPAKVRSRLGPEQLQLCATRQQDDRTYRRLPDMLAETVLGEGEAVLARNLVDDSAFAGADSQGGFSTASTIVAPVRIDGIVVGLMHVYSDANYQELQQADLEFVIAAMDTFGLGIINLNRRESLATSLKQTRAQVTRLQKQLSQRVEIVGSSSAIQRVKEQILRAAPTEATVLVRGESGVGKELVAAAIHHNSKRKEAPLVTMNCAALSPTLLESELFGHEKGAFTGATDRKMGKFEAADGGTLMLDEVGEMAPEIQAKFLRVLEGQAFERVGGNKPIRVNVRVVAATNRDLEQAVRENQFRSDLYYRLHVVEIMVPPLRERGNDIVQIAEFFLARFCETMGRRVQGFTDAAKLRLCQYDWPGNIRELKNVVERAVVLGIDEMVDVKDLTLSSLGTTQLPMPDSTGPVPPPFSPNGPEPWQDNHGNLPQEEQVPMSLSELEKNHILAMLRLTGGNKSKASQILGIERSTLDRKIKRNGLQPGDWK